MPNQKNSTSFDDLTFREVMEEFEHVSSQFEATELDIEQALTLHKRANKLLDELERRLKQAEAAVKKKAA